MLAAGLPTSAMLADAAALGFGDVYRFALLIVVVAWGLGWTLRRLTPGAVAPEPGAVPPPAVAPLREREPVLAASR